MRKPVHHRNCRHAFATAGAVLALSVAAGLPAFAQTASPPARAEVPMRDPWVPPASRVPATAPPSQGAELRAQVERKLRANFDAAAGSAGTLTRQQAAAAGLGFVARHYDEIDQGKTGAVRFEDVKRFMRQRGAQLD